MSYITRFKYQILQKYLPSINIVTLFPTKTAIFTQKETNRMALKYG